MSRANQVKVGERVGAISHAQEATVSLFGYGTYLGMRIPREAGGAMAQAICEHADEVLAELKRDCEKTGKDYTKEEATFIELLGNPCIQLDSGKLVYGCECWWGAEATIKENVDKYTHAFIVDLDDARKGIKREIEQLK